MRLTVRMLLFIVAVIAGTSSLLTGLLVWKVSRPERQEIQPTVSSNPVIEKFRALGELVVLSVYMKDVVDLDDPKEKLKQLWIVAGEALISVDLHRALVKVDEVDSKSVFVTLPKPKVLQARYDHKETRLYNATSKRWWNTQSLAVDTAKATERVFKEGQEKLEQLCGSNEMLDRARPIAEGVVRNLFEASGLTVRIQWQDMAVPVSADNSVSPKQQAPAL